MPTPRPPYPGAPPLDLLQLHTLPRERWVGRAVFHPLCQIGSTPYWTLEDAPDAEPGDEGTAYDVGVVVRVEPGPWGDPDDPATWDVWFLTGSGDTLRYSASNLWTPGS